MALVSRRKVAPFTTTLDPEMVVRLDAMAQVHGTPRAHLIRQAIKQFVEAKEGELTKQAATPRDRQQEA